ncbi:MAG: hypothetical protein HN712_00525 [Gemmatimonadetes bacterium]|nr:hypothetical protein [Gemmatimonadota bacterium]MBT6150299.1 hypothetical protein [Gemmatimonadota bacterium]MBT7858753.1 hypothetical protein [Gemmatimonadota bacterium]
MTDNGTNLLSRDQLREVDDLHREILDPIQELLSGLSHGVAHLQYITFRQFLEGWEEGQGWGEADLYDVMDSDSESSSLRLGVGESVAESLRGLQVVPDGWNLTTSDGIASVLVGLLAMAWQMRGGSVGLQPGSQFVASDREGNHDRKIVAVTHWFGQSDSSDHHVVVCYDESFLVGALT